MSKTDKSTSTPATPTTPIPPNVTKLCHIIKRENFDGYGFNLHSEKIKPGQFIGKVDPDSPALEAGLKEGDRIIEVNGVPIGNETHKQVVQRIKALSNEVRLLLIDVDGKGDVPKSPNALTTTPTKCCTEEQNKCKMNEQEIEEKPVLPKTSPPATPVMLNGNGIAVDQNAMEYHGTKLELPGESANISSISMVSVKRMSSISSGSNHSSTMSSDVVDKAMPASPSSVRSQAEIHEDINIKIDMPKPPMPDLTNGIIEKESKTLIAMNNNNNNNNNMSMNMNSSNNNNNNNNIEKIIMPPLAPIIDPPPTMMTTNVPPPPSSITASNPNKTTKIMTSNGLVNSANGSTAMLSSNNNVTQTHSTTPTIPTAPTSTATSSPPSNNSNGVIRAGSLNLPMTAAEMRAKLLSKKKYDPKQESVDLRKKFEIIQKL